MAGDEGANPLDAVFEQAVKPYLNAAALREDFPADTPVILMRRADDLPKETRELGGGGTLTVPVLAALRDSKYASKGRVGTFAFDTMEPDAVALVLPAGPAPQVRIVTKASGGALLCADLEGMLGAVALMADHPALAAFPGGTFLVDALRTGLTQAKEELMTSLTKPGPSGKSLLDEIAAAAPPAAQGQARPKGRKAGGSAPRARKRA